MKRIVITFVLPVVLAGCAGLSSVTRDPDFALCELARKQARSGDVAAAEATIDRIQDLRDAWYCRNDLIETDRGLHPRGT